MARSYKQSKNTNNSNGPFFSITGSTLVVFVLLSFFFAFFSGEGGGASSDDASSDDSESQYDVAIFRIQQFILLSDQ